MTPHPQAEILRAIADGKTIQGRTRGNNGWFPIDRPQRVVGDPDWELRIKPATININGYEVPEPVREPLDLNTDYWIPEINHPDLADKSVFDDDNVDAHRLKAGLIHLTKEAAIAHAEALLSFTRMEK